MTWWFWIIFGLVLCAIELATPGGIVIVFFGVAGLVVGLLALLDIVAVAWLQWLLFPIFALISLRIFRQPLMQRLGIAGGRDDVDSLVGEIALPVDPITPGGHGRAELRGTTWNAKNVDSVTLTPGERSRVVAVQGLMLDLRKES
jgi:membrane protein implicated in regulation of membrane protease activity